MKVGEHLIKCVIGCCIRIAIYRYVDDVFLTDEMRYTVFWTREVIDIKRKVAVAIVSFGVREFEFRTVDNKSGEAIVTMA